MSDQFFEDEEELARAEAAAQRAPKAKKQPVAASKPAVAAQKDAPKPPSFALVCAIAAVALLLGVCIGYFVAMAVMGGPSGSDQGAQSSVPVATSTAGGSDDAAGMPSDHPDISSMINPDGTVNEEALAEYKAQRAAQQAAEGAQDVDATGSDGAASEDSASN